MSFQSVQNNFSSLELMEINDINDYPGESIIEISDAAAPIERQIDMGTFECHLCDSMFAMRSEQRKHLETHISKTPQNEFQCNLCEKKFRTRCTIKRHQKIHNVYKSFQCTECKYRCTLKSTFDAHTNRHKKIKPHKCSFCDYASADSTHLQRHLKQHTEKPIFCFKCSYRCIQFACLVNHYRKEHNEQHISCFFCNFETRKADDIVQHLIESHKRYWTKDIKKCYICKFQSQTKKEYEDHVRNEKHNITF